MESTGSTTSKPDDKKVNGIPKDMWRFIPAIAEQGLGEKHNRKKLQGLFDSYLKP